MFFEVVSMSLRRFGIMVAESTSSAIMLMHTAFHLATPNKEGFADLSQFAP